MGPIIQQYRGQYKTQCGQSTISSFMMPRVRQLRTPQTITIIATTIIIKVILSIAHREREYGATDKSKPKKKMLRKNPLKPDELILFAKQSPPWGASLHLKSCG